MEQLADFVDKWEELIVGIGLGMIGTFVVPVALLIVKSARSTKGS